MGVKHRYIDRRDWKRATERKSRAMTLPDGSFSHRLDIVRATSPAFGALFAGRSEYVIADTGWTWLSWMRGDYPWALTAMRNPNGVWTQWYFDIVSGMGADEDGRAWFDDMYLDVLVLPDGQTALLDEDELEAAFASGEITLSQRDEAREAANRLLSAFPRGIGPLAAFTKALYDRLA